jgi:hypothetical protein
MDPYLMAAVQALTDDLYRDFKMWLASLYPWLKRQHRRVTADTYSSPAALLDAVKRGLAQDGDLVTLECKPSPFGPFLRDHFLSLLPQYRGGPELVSVHPALAFLGNATSHLSPVGVFPPIGNGVTQVCLYPSDAPTCGLTGLIPEINDLVTYLPAVLADRYAPLWHRPCRIRGELCLVTMDAVTTAGIQVEAYVELLQSGRVWCLDATTDDSDCRPLTDNSLPPLWGGLLASGHMELAPGSLLVKDVVQAVKAAMQSAGLRVIDIRRNKAGRHEVVLNADWFRVCLDGSGPYFYFHMDVDLANDLENARASFDAVCRSALANINTVCDQKSVNLKNPCDLDFTYSNSETVLTVMKSLSADAIQDPLLMAIRDWHRKRSAPAA